MRRSNTLAIKILIGLLFSSSFSFAIYADLDSEDSPSSKRKRHQSAEIISEHLEEDDDELSQSASEDSETEPLTLVLCHGRVHSPTYSKNTAVLVDSNPSNKPDFTADIVSHNFLTGLTQYFKQIDAIDTHSTLTNYFDLIDLQHCPDWLYFDEENSAPTSFWQILSQILNKNGVIRVFGPGLNKMQRYERIPGFKANLVKPRATLIQTKKPTVSIIELRKTLNLDKPEKGSKFR